MSIWAPTADLKVLVLLYLKAPMTLVMRSNNSMAMIGRDEFSKSERIATQLEAEVWASLSAVVSVVG